MVKYTKETAGDPGQPRLVTLHKEVVEKRREMEREYILVQTDDIKLQLQQLNPRIYALFFKYLYTIGPGENKS